MQQEQKKTDLASRISLRTLLLVFTGGIVLLLLTVSLAISLDRFRNYLATELEGRTRDAATAVGLSLTNAIDASDHVAVASLIDSVFDSGDYLVVEMVDHNDQRVAGRSRSLNGLEVPGWFVAWVDLPAPVGTADVMQKWRWLGQVRVVGHPGNAYRDLWRVTWWLLLSSVLVGLVAIGLLYLMLGQLLGPVRALELQAEAIGRRNFRKRTRLRSTRDLNQVIRAMNQMTDDVEQLFSGQAALIAHLRKLNNEDSLTGLATRNAFDQRLAVEAVSEEERKPGALILAQVSGFADFNQRVGRLEADELLIRLAADIRRFEGGHTGSFAGRRSGAEFAIFIPGGAPADALIWARELVDDLQARCLDFLGANGDAAAELQVHAGVAGAGQDVSVKTLFEAADVALRRAQQAMVSGCEISDSGLEGHHGAQQWRALLEEALDRQALWLWEQPLLESRHESVTFRQVYTRLLIDREWVRGNVFVPNAERFGLMARLDLMVLDQALAELRRDPEARLGISLGMSSLMTPDFSERMLERATAAGADMQRLWIGVAEQTVHLHRRAAQVLIRRLRRTGAQMMVDRFGVGGIPFSYMKNLSIQALRIDSSFIHGIDRHEENRFYLESVIAIAHGRGVRVFAAGVETDSEWQMLQSIGIDAGIGYHLGRPGPSGDAPVVD